MSAATQSNCACPTPVVTEVPGVQGTAGSNGNNGTNGVDAFTTTTSNFNIPGATGGTVNIPVSNSTWMAIGQVIVVGVSGGLATFTVNAKPTSTNFTGAWLNLSGDSAAGSTINSGAIVSPGGRATKIVAVGQFTDNSGGTPSDTIAAGIGVITIPIYVQLAQITATTIFSYTPGFAFKVLGISFSVEVAVTTAAKLATVTPAVNGSTVTGGALALTSANATPKGATIAGSAITAANAGTSAQTLSLVASAVTPFSEGTGWILLKVQNMDQANTTAAMASKINSILTALS